MVRASRYLPCSWKMDARWLAHRAVSRCFSPLTRPLRSRARRPWVSASVSLGGGGRVRA